MTVKAYLPATPLEPNSQGEQELVQRIRAGDLLAFRRFYENHVPLVYNYIRFRVADDEEAEALTAKVFIEIYEALPAYEWRGNPVTAWLFRMAHNQVVTTRRKRRLAAWTRWLPWRARGRESGERQIDQPDVILQALNTLSYEEQVILYLAYYAGYSQTEIAGLLGKTTDAVGMIRYRTLQRLGKVIKHVPGDPT